MFREVAEFSGVLGFCRIGNSLTHAVDRALIIEDIRAMFLGCCFFFLVTAWQESQISCHVHIEFAVVVHSACSLCQRFTLLQKGMGLLTCSLSSCIESHFLMVSSNYVRSVDFDRGTLLAVKHV